MWAPAVAVVLLLSSQAAAAATSRHRRRRSRRRSLRCRRCRPPFDVWLAELRTEAEARGISPEVIDRALTGIEPVAQILERDRTQAEFTLSLDAYLRRRLPPRTVRTARDMYRRHRALVERVDKAYGVDPRLLIAVWGLESEFGRFAGVRPTVRRWRRWPTIRGAARCSATSCSTRSRSSIAATSSSSGSRAPGPARWASRSSCRRATCAMRRTSTATAAATSGRRRRMSSPRSRTTCRSTAGGGADAGAARSCCRRTPTTNRADVAPRTARCRARRAT